MQMLVHGGRDSRLFLEASILCPHFFAKLSQPEVTSLLLLWHQSDTLAEQWRNHEEEPNSCLGQMLWAAFPPAIAQFFPTEGIPVYSVQRDRKCLGLVMITVTSSSRIFQASLAAIGS